MNIRTYGTDERLAFCREYLLCENIRSVRDIILLPIPTSRDGVTVNKTGKTPEELFPLPNVSSAVVGYAIPPSFREWFSSVGMTVIDVSLDDVFVEENARLTADGTVGRILTEQKAAPSELSIGIIGYGRIGKRLLNLLSFMGARITLFTTRDTLRRELGMIGVYTESCRALSDASRANELSKLDVIINTAPASFMSEEVASSLPATTVIELASGNNFPKAANAVHYASVPAAMYPKSAGKVLRDSVLRMLGE